MPIVNVHAAGARLSRLIDDVAAGEEIIITKAGKPVARLMPMEANPRPKRKLGLLAGRAQIPTDFDAPLPEEVLASFEKWQRRGTSFFG